MLKSKKVKGLLTLLTIYISAFFVGLLFFYLLKDKIDFMFNLFIADVVATIFIWIIGIFLNTASIYDPYWSIQTVVIYLSLQIGLNRFTVGNVLFLILLLFWAIRLTYNFIRGFNDITYIDWRYAQIRNNTGVFYQLVNLLGIHLVPTIIVFLASVPAFIYVIEDVDFSWAQIIGFTIMFVGTMLELVSDRNMAEFKKVRKNNSEIINIGLWKYSRHPNYLGEILFWYGVAMVLILSNFAHIYLIFGAILNTLLFLFISIPLAENHLKSYKEGFDDYKKRTRMLFPFKK